MRTRCTFTVAAAAFAALAGIAHADTASADLSGEARTLVERWLAAQNRGDFAAYQALYAARFTGVRRSGNRTVKLDRKGWVKDRARMFQKPMVVSIEKLQVDSGGPSARAEFVQRFASGSYKDAGRKRMVLVREEGQTRIAREEMLESRTEAPRETSELDRFGFVVDGKIVLATDTDEAWATSIQLVSPDDPVTVRRGVDPKRLPPEAARWLGKKVRVTDAAGASCIAQVGAPSLLARVTPHFGTLHEWRDLKPRAEAEAAWQLASGGRLLVAELKLPDGCTSPRWSRAADLPPAPFAAATDAISGRSSLALRAFRKLDEWKRIQSEFRGEYKGTGNWDESDGTAQVHEIALGKTTLIVVTAHAGRGCGDFEGELWAVFDAHGDKLTLRASAAESLTPVGAIDSDGDGTPELLYDGRGYGGGEGRIDLAGGNASPTEEISIPFLDCPC